MGTWAKKSAFRSEAAAVKHTGVQRLQRFLREKRAVTFAVQDNERSMEVDKTLIDRTTKPLTSMMWSSSRRGLPRELHAHLELGFANLLSSRLECKFSAYYQYQTDLGTIILTTWPTPTRNSCLCTPLYQTRLHLSCDS